MSSVPSFSFAAPPRRQMVMGMRRRSGPLLAVAIVFGMAAVALLFGLMVPLMPPGTVAKGSALIAVGVVLLVALATITQSADANDGRLGRQLLNAWVALLGACPAYLPFKFHDLPGLNPLRLCFAVLAMVWLYGLVTSPRLRRTLLRNAAVSRWPLAAFAALFAWQLVTSLTGDQPAFSIYYVVKAFGGANLVLLVCLTYYRDWKDVQRTMGWLAAGAVAACVAGLVEWRLQSNLFASLIPNDPEQMAAMEWIVGEKTRGGAYRVSGTYSHPLALAEYLCIVLPIAAAALSVTTSRWIRALCTLAIPLGLLVIYLTHTRSSIVAVGAAGLFAALLVGVRATRRSRSIGRAMIGWLAIITVSCAMVALPVLGSYLAQGRDRDETGSSYARVQMFERGVHRLEDRPLHGYGGGLSASVIGPLQGQRTLTIDSYFLSIAIEAGYPGLLLFVAAMFAAMGPVTAVALTAPSSDSHRILVGLAAGAVGSLVVKLILSLTNNFELLYLVFGLCLVALSLLRQQTKPEQTLPWMPEETAWAPTVIGPDDWE